MNLASVMDELGNALQAVDGLNVYPYSTDRVAAPAAIVGFPDKIDFDMTARRGLDSMSLPLFLLVSRVDQRSGRDALAAYLNGSGPQSLKQAIDGYEFTACNTVRIATAQVASMSSAGVDYLGAELTLMISGKGVA